MTGAFVILLSTLTISPKVVMMYMIILSSFFEIPYSRLCLRHNFVVLSVRTLSFHESSFRASFFRASSFHTSSSSRVVFPHVVFLTHRLSHTSFFRASSYHASSSLRVVLPRVVFPAHRLPYASSFLVSSFPRVVFSRVVLSRVIFLTHRPSSCRLSRASSSNASSYTRRLFHALSFLHGL